VATILVVDDAPEIRDLLTMFLADEGFAVTACDRADAALARLALSLPDLLILDGRLPGMSGWQCLDLLRASDRTTGLPVLMLTAAADDLERATQAPPDDCTIHVAKPFDVEALLAAIHRVIETCEQQPVAV
jgi:two-component system phosphate regulon response regulator PhoB